MALLPQGEKSLWREYSPGQTYPALNDDLETDVAVVGAGITGLTTAYLLKQRGLRVIVAEKDTVGGGTSGRTTGKVTSQHGITYQDLYQRLGGKPARAYAGANQSAVEQIDRIIRRESIRCDWQRDDNYVFTAEKNQTANFRQEAETAAKLGLPAEFTTETPLPFGISAAVKFSGQGKINCLKYLLGLASAIDGQGSRVFERSTVTDIRDGSPCLIRTGKGTITAKHIVVATSVPAFPLAARIGYCILEYPTESFILAAKSPRPLNGMYISPDKNHNSILPVAIDGRQHIIFAGEGGNLPGFRLDKKSRHQRLADYGRKHFGISEITNRWSDRDYSAYDGLPLTGKAYPWSKELYIASAYRKWGLSNGTAAAIILCDLITGQPNPWAEHFTPQRITPVKSIPQAITRHLNTHWHKPDL